MVNAGISVIGGSWGTSNAAIPVFSDRLSFLLTPASPAALLLLLKLPIGQRMNCATILSSCIAVWLSQHGYQPAQRDAVLKQLWTESRLQPCVIASSGSSYLPQWAGSRLRRAHQRLG